DGEIQRVGKGMYAHKEYVPPPNQTDGRRKRGRRSVEPVPRPSVPTDAATYARSKQAVENERQNSGICPSVASVRQSTDTGLATEAENGSPAFVPTQTDQTDGQMDGEHADALTENEAAALSGDLSGIDGQTNGGSSAAALKPSTADDIPECLRRCDHCG